MDLSLVADNWTLFAEGVWTTLWLVTLSLILGGLMAIPLAVVQAFRVPVLGQLAAGYSYAIRGTPVLIQVYLLYYGLAQFEAVRTSVFWPLLRDAQTCALIGFALNSAAYTGEILRGAIAAIPRGLHEAAAALGLSRWMAIRLVVLPLAIRRSLPAYSNEVIFMIHASVIASTITVVDILGAGRQLNSTYYVVYEGFLTAAVLYMALVLLVTLAFRMLEIRFLDAFTAGAQREKAAT